ncbi:MAG: DUF2490 domain-containing protein [Bacteroidetes bacterium]|nr:DUF2490 domain-containing protein [Bacteroidota bacterium]
MKEIPNNKNKFKNNLIFPFIIFCFLISFTLVKAQNQPDAGMWNTLSIEKEISSKFSISVDEELRLKENFTQINLLYTNLGFNFTPIKRFKVSLIYRLIEKSMIDGNYTFRNRLMLDMSYKIKKNKFSVSYRSRIQSEVRSYYSSELGKIPEWFWRSKFELKYDLNKFTPYIGTEIRYQIKDPRNPEFDAGFHRLRTFAGIDYKINKRNSCGIYYLIQNEFGISNPQDLYILGVEYSISLGKFKRNKAVEN